MFFLGNVDQEYRRTLMQCCYVSKVCFQLHDASLGVGLPLSQQVNISIERINSTSANQTTVLWLSIQQMQIRRQYYGFCLKAKYA